MLAQSLAPGVAVLPQVLTPRVRLPQKGDHPHSTPQQPLFVLPVLCSKAGSHLFKGETLVRLGTLKSLFISLFAICYLFFAPDQVYFVIVVCLFCFVFVFLLFFEFFFLSSTTGEMTVSVTTVTDRSLSATSVTEKTLSESEEDVSVTEDDASQDEEGSNWDSER